MLISDVLFEINLHWHIWIRSDSASIFLHKTLPIHRRDIKSHLAIVRPLNLQCVLMFILRSKQIKPTCLSTFCTNPSSIIHWNLIPLPSLIANSSIALFNVAIKSNFIPTLKQDLLSLFLD